MYAVKPLRPWKFVSMYDPLRIFALKMLNDRQCLKLQALHEIR